MAGRESEAGIWIRRRVERGKLQMEDLGRRKFVRGNDHGDNRGKVWKQEQESEKHYGLIMMAFVHDG